MAEVDLEIEPMESGGSTTIVSDMSAAEILRKAESDRIAAEAIREDMEAAQMMSLAKLLDRATAATARIEKAADEIEIMLEVTQESMNQVKEQAQEIKEIVEPTPPAAPEAAPPAVFQKTPRKLPSFLI